MRQNTDPGFRFTDEEMETAKGTDLPELLQHLGYSVRRLGSRHHTVSPIIFNYLELTDSAYPV